MLSILKKISLVFYSIYLFHKVHMILERDGMSEAWDVFINNAPTNKKLVDIDKSVITKIVNNASIFHKYNNQCLEKGFVLYQVLHKLGFSEAVLFIGVANYPFRSHAWIELNGEIINDYYDNIKKWKIIKSSGRRSSCV